MLVVAERAEPVVGVVEPKTELLELPAGWLVAEDEPAELDTDEANKTALPTFNTSPGKIRRKLPAGCPALGFKASS